MECRTDVVMHQYNFKWSIKKFSYQLECAQNESKYISLKSTSFKIKIDESNTEWYMKLYLHGRVQYRRDLISIFAFCDDFGDKSEIWGSQNYYFVNANGELDEVSRCPFSKFLINDRSWGVDKLYSQKQLLEDFDTYLPNDTLTIVCQLNLMGEKVMETAETIAPTVTKNELGNDLIKLLQSEEFADFTFIVCDTKIKAHKAILAARSTVFARMFKFGLEETDECVLVVDMDLETFRIMLQYIYTNKVDNLDNVAVDLLHVADKYGLSVLKEMCEESLYRQVTLLNAAEVFVLANRCNAKQLIQYVQNFMIKNIVSVMKTAGYEAMEQEHPRIARILYRALAMKQEKEEK